MRRSPNVLTKLWSTPWSTTTSLPKAKTEAHNEIPTRNGLPLLGTSLSIIAAGSAPKFHQYIHARHKESGPIFRENTGMDSLLFTSDPEIMRFIFSVEGKYPRHYTPKAWTLYNQIYGSKRGLFFMDGEEWLTYRKPLNKHFLKNDVTKGLCEVHKVIVGDLIDRWRRFDGGLIEKVDYEFYRHSLSFVLGSVLGSSYIEKRAEYSDEISNLASTFQSIFETTSKLSLTPPELAQKLGLQTWKKFETAVHNSLASSQKLVRKMMDQRSPDGFLDKMIEEKIDFDRTVAILADLLLAAGDTTANANQWILYLLAKNEDSQEDILEKPELVKGVIREALRLYPPAVFITRFLPETVSFKGYTFNKDEIVTLSMYTAGRDEDVYPEAEKFLPRRWLRTGSKHEGVKQANSFLPFAMGVRSCIGAKIALSLLHLTTEEIVKNYKLSLKEEVDITLKLVPVPDKPLKIELKARNRV